MWRLLGPLTAWLVLTAFGAVAETPPAVPAPDHVVLAIMENHSYSDVIGNASAPYINFLKNAGANFTDSHGVGHPSEER